MKICRKYYTLYKYIEKECMFNGEIKVEEDIQEWKKRRVDGTLLTMDLENLEELETIIAKQ